MKLCYRNVISEKKPTNARKVPTNPVKGAEGSTVPESALIRYPKLACVSIYIVIW